MKSPAALLVLLSLLGPARQKREQPAARTPAPGGAAQLALIRKDPGRFLGAEVRVTLQFQRTIADWNPFLSRFGPSDWVGLAVWPDESFTWDSAVFDDPASRLFVRRGSSLADMLGKARTYQRFEAGALVREAFLGEPWLEITELTPLPDEVGEGTILHVGRARELAAEGQWSLALEQYQRAKAAPLPPHALAAIEREILETRLAGEEEARQKKERTAGAAARED